MSDFFKKTFPIYTSNSLKNLAEKCRENLGAKAHLHKTYLAYPSNEAKDFLVQTFVQKNSSIFGIRFITIQQFIHLALKICLQKDLSFPSHYELMFFLEEEITSLSKRSVTLQTYLAGKEERAISLASNLSHVFLDYLLYGKNALPTWLEKRGWQQALFQKVCSRWTSLIDAIDKAPPPPFSISLHIFGVNSIPTLYLEFLEKLASKFSITFYFLSPSPLFWGDLVSRKKSAYLDSLFQRSGTSLEKRLDFADKAKGDHPLLAHFSTMGAPLYNYLQEHDVTASYEEIKMESDLTYIQKALLYQVKPLAPPYQDGSISIHAAPSLLREVEIVLANISLFLQNQANFSPSDVAVLAPNIDLYYPFISFLFAKNSYPFSYAITGLKKTMHNKSLAALSLLFSLIGSRFEKDHLLKLFSLPHFQRKGGIGEEEVQLLQKIIDHTGIRWGFDRTAKSSFLEEEGDDFGVFKKGFAHILDSIPREDSSIEFSQVESIGDIILLIENLHKDITAFVSSKQTLAEFLERSIGFANTYLALDEEADYFFKELKKISTLALSSTYLYSFQSFQRLLAEIFAGRGSREKTYESPPIVFSSMENAPPVSKALFFMGLDGESFPKKRTYRSLNELEGAPLYERKPSPAEKARYYLLQAIQTAKGAISFSFTANSPVDGKKRSASPLLEEISHALLLPPPKTHPFLPYDARYFEHRHPFTNAYELYLASQEKERFSPFAFQALTTKKETAKSVSYKELALLFRSPAAFFYNLSTRMYENPFFTPTMFDDGEFVLSYLDRAIITKSGAKESRLSLTKWQDRGRLPTALFEKAATKELEGAITFQKKMVEQYLFQGDPYLHLHLDQNIENPIYQESTLFLPAITFSVAGTTYTIEGEIDGLTEKGILSLKKASTEEYWKSLPLLILLAHLETPIPLQMHFLKEGVTRTFDREKLRPLLAPLLSYYEKALQEISPFLPETIEPFAKDRTFSYEAIKGKILSSFKDPYLEKATPKPAAFFEKEITPLAAALKEEGVHETL